MYIQKVYDDPFKQKSFHVVFTTYTFNGQKIDSAKLAESVYFGEDTVKLLQNKIIQRVSIDENYQITIQQKTTTSPFFTPPTE